jgi:hypothetical protein
MGLFSTRKSRATRRAEARAIKRRAKLDAKYAAHNERRRIKSAQRSAEKALRAQIKAQRDSDKASLKVAETNLKAAEEGRLLSPTRIRRTLTVTRLLAPIVVPIAYRVAIGARGWLDERSSHGARLSGRIAAAEQSVRTVAEKNPKDTETKQFVAAITGRLKDLSGAVTAAEGMPSARRRAAHAAIAAELDGVEADLLARLGLH